ncbi:ABC transporter substrate-binding protein [Luteimonas salinilitoris]|uniref:ABC transporter substrate-binding protein n=1 Tax=Luteimonas salinilitoris TaxID=3237697 RepID=A0ABV4HNV2_9GAMM
MKRVFVLGVAVALLALAAGCARDAGGDAPVVGFSQVGAESEWRTANTRSVRSAIEEAGFRLRFSDAQQKQENQIKALRSFIAQRVDVIAFSPVVESGWETVLREAKAAGIPVILTDRSVDVSDESLYVTLIGSDFVEEGRKAARWLLEESPLRRGEDREGPVRIVELQGTVGSAPAIDRGKGFREVLGDDQDYRIVRTQSGDFTRARGKEVMEAFLKSEGGDNIDVLFAHNDDMAIGAIQAIEESGLRPGEDILVISIDAVRGAFEAMMAGKLNVTVECNPLLGPQLVDAIRAVQEGRELPRRIVVEESVFTREQAAEVFPSRQY